MNEQAPATEEKKKKTLVEALKKVLSNLPITFGQNPSTEKTDKAKPEK